MLKSQRLISGCSLTVECAAGGRAERVRFSPPRHMNRIKVFISYSSKQKVLGGKFKYNLEKYCGYETFIAHDDIPASALWEEEIISNINSSHFFLPLISKDFRESLFTDQETGIAICLGKKIIPVNLDGTNPYGFIQKYQALQYKKYPPGFHFQDNMSELVLTIAQIELYKEESSYYDGAVNSIIYAFYKSPSFEVTNAIIQLLCKCKGLSPNHIAIIKKAIETNSQVAQAYGLETLKECLRKYYKVSVD